MRSFWVFSVICFVFWGCQGTRSGEEVGGVKHAVESGESVLKGRNVQVLEEKWGSCVRLFDSGSAFEGYERFSSGLSYFLQGNYQKSADEFVVGLGGEVSAPDSVREDALLLAGVSFYRLGLYEESGSYFRQLGEGFGEYGRQMLIRSCFGAKDYSCVLSLGEGLGGVEFETYRGLSYEASGQYKHAISILGKLKKPLKGYELEVLLSLSRAHEGLSETGKSLEALRAIYEMNPKSDQGKMAELRILALKDVWPEAFKFPRNLEKESSKSRGIREQAIEDFKAHRSEKAIKGFEKLVADGRGGKSNKGQWCEDVFYLARSYVKLRKHSSSVPHFREGISRCGGTDQQIKLLYSGARAAWNSGDKEGALKYYKQIIDEYAKHSYADDAYHFSAKIMSEMGDEQGARGMLEKQLSLYPDGDMAKDSYWMMFEGLYGSKDWQGCVAFAERYRGKSKEDDIYSMGRLDYFAGRAYEQMSKVKEATSLYYRVMEEYPLGYYAMLSMKRLREIDGAGVEEWVKKHHGGGHKAGIPEDYCFSEVIAGHKSFGYAKRFIRLGMYEEGLNELEKISIDDEESRRELLLSKAMLYAKMGKVYDSVKLAKMSMDVQKDFNSGDYSHWLLGYPQPWLEHVVRESELQGLPKFLVYAIMREESVFNPRAESWANARGLMQLMEATAASTAKELGDSVVGREALFNPEVSIRLGAAYLGKLMRLFDGELIVVIPSYNAGQGNMRKWLKRYEGMDLDLFVEKIAFKEAREYAKRVSMTLWRYQWLYGYL